MFKTPVDACFHIPPPEKDELVTVSVDINKATLRAIKRLQRWTRHRQGVKRELQDDVDPPPSGGASASSGPPPATAYTDYGPYMMELMHRDQAAREARRTRRRQSSKKPASKN